MKRKLFMGVDLGTSFIKTGVYDLDGKRHAGASEAVKDERPAPGVYLQYGEELYRSVCSCIRRTVQGLGESDAQVEAIAFTGQMAGAMGVDQDWRDITTWSCTLDSRYLPYAGRQRGYLADDFFRLSGTCSPVMCSKYEWFREKFPVEAKKIAKYIMLNGYMIGKFSGVPVEEAMIDHSLIAWTGMSDIAGRTWSDVICGKLGIEPSLLPKIAPCTGIGGYLKEDIAAQLGLRAGLPLVLGAGDKVSGCVGVGILDYGDMIFEASSYGAVSCKVQDVRQDGKGHNYDVIGAIDEDGYYLHKYIQGSGISADWYVANFLNHDFAKAEELASKVPAGSEHMMAIGLLGGSAIPFNAELKGMFMGHTWVHGQGHFYRSLLESFSYDLAITLGSMTENYPDCRDASIKLIGGGAKSSIWPQMLADVTGHRFETIDREDAALWGAAMLAAAGTGELADIRSVAKEHVTVKHIFEPDEEKSRVYRPYVKLYEEFRNEMGQYFSRLAEL